MSLIQRNAVPLLILLAVIAVGVGVLLSRSPSAALGEEPAGCNVSTVGISILSTGADGATVTETYHGATITYQVILSIPELPQGDTACNYGGGALTITLPNGEANVVADDDAATTDIPAIPTIEVGSPFTASAVSYVVDQSDATNMELTARADYSGGSTDSVPAGQDKPPAGSSISNTVRIQPPSIEIDMMPDTTPDTAQLVYLGESAVFDITVTNTGGFALSNVFVSDERAQDCVRDFATLAVDAVENYQCSVKPGNNFINEATVIGEVVGGVPEDQTQVTATDTSEVQVESVAISVTIEPDLQRVRIGNVATFSVTVEVPGTTALDNVTVSVPLAPDCDRSLGSLAAAAQEVYTCTESADPDVDGSLAQGTHTVTATASGEVPGLSTLTASDDAVVEVFALDLWISIEPEDQTIRSGDYAAFTITVGNFGDTALTNVVITNDMVPECDGTYEVLDPGAEESYECDSSALTDDLTDTATVNAIAPDDGPVSASDSANVSILRPSTAVGLEELNTTILRLVVQTLRVTETNDGDSDLTNVCVELDTAGNILPLVHEETDAMMEGEGMEGEAMEGEEGELVADPCAGSDPDIIVLTRDSVEYVTGDEGDDGIMGIGETWEWRVITVGIAGNYVPLAEDALNMRFVAVGHGTDELGSDITFPGDAEELGEIDVPIVTR